MVSLDFEQQPSASETAASIVASLDSFDSVVRLKALRSIKNSVIGNQAKKSLFLSLNIARRLVFFLSDLSFDVVEKIEAAVVIGSLALGSDERNMTALIEANVVPPLLNLLCEKDQNLKLLEATGRSLKAIFQSPQAPRNIVHMGTTIEDLLQFLSRASFSSEVTPLSDIQTYLRISEVVASILSHACSSPVEQMRITDAGAIPLLTQLLDISSFHLPTDELSSPKSKKSRSEVDHLGRVGTGDAFRDGVLFNSYPKVQEAALEALGSLCRGDRQKGTRILNTATGSGERHQTEFETFRILLAYLIILPTLIKLFSEPCHTSEKSSATKNSIPDQSWMTIRERSPLIFAQLIGDHEDLQRASMDGEAIKKLASILIDLDCEKISQNIVVEKNAGKKMKRIERENVH
ncbi:hypothetical protein HK096_008227, partial [Nowakowskiella sp. JEL0078]